MKPEEYFVLVIQCAIFFWVCYALWHGGSAWWLLLLLCMPSVDHGKGV